MYVNCKLLIYPSLLPFALWKPYIYFLCETVSVLQIGSFPFLILIYHKISPGEGNGNPLQYSCLKNPMDGGAWWATIHAWGRKESDTTERLHFPFQIYCPGVGLLDHTETLLFSFLRKVHAGKCPF